MGYQCIRMQLEFTRNANEWAPTQTSWVRSSGLKSRVLWFLHALQEILRHPKMWGYCPRVHCFPKQWFTTIVINCGEKWTRVSPLHVPPLHNRASCQTDSHNNPDDHVISHFQREQGFQGRSGVLRTNANIRCHIPPLDVSQLHKREEPWEQAHHQVVLRRLESEMTSTSFLYMASSKAVMSVNAN